MTRHVDFAPLPLLGDAAENWPNILISKAHRLSKDSNMSLHDVLSRPVSFESFYYQSPAWTAQKRDQDAQDNMMHAFFRVLGAR